MSAGFGWSLSDVILLTNAAQKTVKALNDDTGAKSQYQKVIRSLVDLETTLHDAHSIIKIADPVFRNAARGQLDLSTSSIREFHDKLVSKYGAMLKAEVHGKASSRFRSKVHWAFSAAEEVSEFRAHLSGQLDTVKFLMITHIWNTVTESKENVNTSHALVLEVINASTTNSAEFRAKIDDLRSVVLPYLEIKKELNSVQAVLSTEITDASRTIKNDLTQSLSLIQKALENSNIKNIAASHSARLGRSATRKQLSKIENRQLRSRRAQVALVNSFREICTELSNLRLQERLVTEKIPVDDAGQPKSTRTAVSESKNRVEPAVSLRTLQVETVATISQVEFTNVLQWLQYLLATVKHCITQLLHCLPGVIIYIRIFHNLARRSSIWPLRIMAGDMIRCENFAGQESWIDKSYFQHFKARYRPSELSEANFSKVFDTFIRNKYKDGDDSKSLKQIASCIVALESTAVEAHANNWSLILTEDWKVIILATLDVNKSGVCPYCESTVLNYGSNGLNTCLSCHQIFVIGASSTSPIDPSTSFVPKTNVDSDLPQRESEYARKRFKYIWASHKSSLDDASFTSDENQTIRLDR